jgi:CDP-paratose 2-epimerase
MKYRNLLITGGAGFIGSNLAVGFKQKYPGLKVYVLDNLSRSGSRLNLPRLKDNQIKFIRGDIRNPKDLNFNFHPDLMIECSAEPSILAGFNNPPYIINNNLVGTVNCLELCRRQKTDIIFLSTSRVYPYQAINKTKIVQTSTRFKWLSAGHIPGLTAKGINEGFTTCGPKTLYGATKLASELLLEEYIADYGIKGVINRCGVIAGPWQFGKVDQGIFTYWMLAHYFKRPLKYIGFGGRGKQVRDLLHIDDLFNLIDLQVAGLSGISGRIYNVGGGDRISLSLCETTDLCRRITGNKIKIGSCLTNRPGDIAVYISDTSKVKKELSWRPVKDAGSILADTYAWIHKTKTKLEDLS